jgi:hypothetical protein
VFIYDRIVTDPLHRRRGLATALIAPWERREGPALPVRFWSPHKMAARCIQR